MRRLLTKIKAFFNSLLLARADSGGWDAMEELTRLIFECLRNIALCALVLGVGVWLHIKPLLPPFYQKFVPKLLYIGKDGT